MAQSVTNPNDFDLFITCVDKVGPMLKIWGQCDRLSSMFVEQLIKMTHNTFEANPTPFHLKKLQVGTLCCAKYKDGVYYRAKVTNLRSLVSGSIEVNFIDYGNIEIIQLDNIRLLENVAVGLTTMKPQANDFFLANVMHINQDWDENSLAFVHQDIAYIELKCTVVGVVNDSKLITVSFHGNDLADYLVQKGIAIKIPLTSQESYIRSLQAPTTRMMHAPPPQMHPAQMLQNQPPGIRMPMHQGPPPFQQHQGIQGPPPPFQQRVQQQQQAAPPPQQQPQMSPIATPELCSYRTLPLEPNSEHMVYVSYVEDGPYLFSIQLQSMEESLTKLMIEMNEMTNLLPLNETPLPGYPCMARCLEDESLCRAVILNLVEGKCKTYYVDFGNTDILPFSNIFQIPFKYMLPKVMSMRFTLNELKNVNVTTEMKCQFKEYVTNRLLKLKVLRLESTPILQYCELYDESNQNIIDILYGSTNQYKTIQINKGQKLNVIVSFIEGCKKFFVQLKESSEALANLMRNLASCSEQSAPLQKIDIGMSCVAFYSGDNQWYRAQIVNVADNNSITVKYVDYGNVDTVAFSCVKKIDPSYVKILPAQAIECCLYGYQNMSFNTEIENVFESLTLECEFLMRVMAKQSHDSTVLVDLFDASGNNVAALLIEKLASQKSDLLSPGPLPANKVTRSLSLIENENDVGKMSNNSNSPKQEKYSWRNAENDKTPPKKDDRGWKNSGDGRRGGGDERREPKSFNDDRKSWRSSGAERNSENVPPNSNRENNRTQNHNGWNGDSPTNKRSQHQSQQQPPPNQRTERSYSRGSRESDVSENLNKFRSDKFDKSNKRHGAAPDKRQSPQNDFGGKKSNWNNSGSESEKSWSGSVGGGRSKKDFNSRPPRRQNSQDFQKKSNDFAPSPPKAKSKPELPVQDLAPVEQPFAYPELQPSATENISISWFYDPENFYIQLRSSQNEFRDMMTDIQSAYVGQPPVSTTLPIGSSVIAEFHEDTVLYRATIVENKPPKYKVQYVDFGNVSVVDSRKIWQVERKFMNLPIQAIKCGISNLKPVNDTWAAAEDLDRIFNKELFTAIFDGCDEEKYYIQIFDNDISIRQQLIDCGLAVDPSSAVQMIDQQVETNVLLGQNINVKISFVENYDIFYVHLEKEKAANVNEAINTFMQETSVESLLKLTEEHLVVGTACLVKMDESTWRRAVITDNSDSAALKVAYPDFGGTSEYSSDQLYSIPSELCIYWYQAFACSLHNFTETTTKLITEADFKEKYEGQNLIIYVDEILDERLIVTLYDLTGKKLELIEPDEGAFPTIEPICPLPVFNTSVSVWVSHVNSVSSLYLQRDCDGDKIAELLTSLHEHYETQEGEETKEFAKDDLCVAKSEDGNWYRGRVLQVTDDGIEVLYIDYGNTETVQKTNIKALDLTQFGMHEYALNVSLNLQEVSEELTNRIKQLLNEQLLTANIAYGETGWFVDLTNNELNLNQTLIDEKLAIASGTETYPIETIEEEHESVAQEIAPPVEEETRAQILITHIDSPSEFYVQLMINQDSIFELQADLQEKVADLPDLDSADIGALCAAMYTVDEQWYRAEVLDADSEITTVRFIDYGNTDVINNKQSSIKTLPADLLSIDKYARKCSLNVKPIKDEEWSQEASEMFEASVQVDVIHADIVYQDEKNKTYVELFVDGTNVAQQLLDNNLAVVIDRNIEDNIANNTGFVSHLNSVSEFWIQLESSVADLEMIVDRLASADSFPDLLDLSPGVLCAANFPDDEMWYRARILSNTVAGIEVLFVDYGNSSTAMKLKVLPEDLIQMPPLAQKFSLNKPGNVECWSDKANEKFTEISADGATIFTIKKLAAGETSIVELFVDDQNILDELLVLCDLNSAPVTPSNQQKLLKIQLTHVESPDHFWVQLHSDNDKIDEMMEKLASAGDFKELHEFDVDTTCAALYEYSSLWYRAKVCDTLSDSEYEVLLVDYGNTINTKCLRTLPSEIEEMPPLATLCMLELPKDTTEWTSEAIKNFTEIAADKNADFRIEFVDTDVPSKVKLYLNGKNVADQICTDNKVEEKKAATVSLTTDEVTLLAVNTELPDALLNDDEEEEEDEGDSTLKLEDETEPTTNTTSPPIVEVLEAASTSGTDETTDSVECSSLNANQSIITSEEFTNESNNQNNIVINTELIGNGDVQTNNKTEALTLGDGTITNIILNTTDDSELLTNNNESSKTIVDEELSETQIEDNKHIELLTNIIESSKTSIDEFYKTVIERTNNDNNIDIAAGNDDTELLTNIIESSKTSVDELPETQIEQSNIDIVAGNDDLIKTDDSELLTTNESSKTNIDEVSETQIEDSNKDATQAEDSIKDNTIDIETGTNDDDTDRNALKNNKEKHDSLTFSCETGGGLAESVITKPSSRPSTPHCDKIVPGSICRGDLETPPPEDDESQVLNKIITEQQQQANTSRPATPHNEKIVPGSISRGEEKLHFDFEAVVSRPATPLSEKIVPGSINRGDLSEPPIEDDDDNDKKKSILESVMSVTERPATPKIPLEEKILPGCLNQDVD